MLTALRKAGRIGLGVVFIGATMGVAVHAFAQNAATDDEAAYSLREVDLFGADDLVDARLTCALGKMPEAMRRTKAFKFVKAELPAADIYCLKVLSVTGAKQRGPHLYIRLAMNEQGFFDFDNSAESKYVAHDEPGRTMAAVLQAASAGQTTYTGIAGHSHELPCALALDAGATWAETAANAAPPAAFSADEAASVAHECYDPTVNQITVHGTAMPATKAGLFVGAWYGKQ